MLKLVLSIVLILLIFCYTIYKNKTTTFYSDTVRSDTVRSDTVRSDTVRTNYVGSDTVSSDIVGLDIVGSSNLLDPNKTPPLFLFTEPRPRIPGLTTGEASLPDAAETEREEKIKKSIEDIPRNSSCNDEFAECEMWANNNECVANPNFMLKHCKKSCSTCNLTLSELTRLNEYYLSTPLSQCIYRGSGYPNVI